MQVAAQTMSRMASRWPAYLMIALGLAVAALAALAVLVSPTFAQETAEAATAAEPVDLAPLGAGLAAISIVGPGLAIGILAGMSASAISRNPDAAPQIRSVAVLMAAFAECLGIIALVVALALVFVG